MPTTKGLFTTNRAYTALLRNTWVSTQYNVPVYQTDPYFNYTTILLSGDTFNTKTFNSDASVNNFNLTVVGDTKASKFSPYGTNWSNYFDGTGDYLSVPDNDAFDLAAGDWTIETWFNLSVLPVSTDASTFASQWRATSSISLAWFVYLYNNAGTYQLYLTYSTTGTNQFNLSVNLASAPSISSWNHVAFVRTGNNFLIFLNGTQVDSTQTLNATIFNSNTPIWVGAQNSAGSPLYQLNGYLSNLRIVKGTAVYTSNFTPSTTPLTAISGTSLLTCQSNRVIDNSTNAFTITVNGNTTVSSFDPFVPNSSYSTYGSGYFDGTGDYIKVPANAALSFDADFCIECWVNTSTISLDPYGRRLWSFGSGVGTYLDATFYEVSAITSNLCIQVPSTGIVITGTIPVANSQWNHVALTRSGSSMKLFVNGVQSGSTYTTAGAYSAGATNGMYIGCLGEGVGGFLLGYVTDLRVVKGTAVYTGNFTPPTAPLQVESVSASYSNTANVNYSPAANTSLLTMQYKQPHNNHTFFDSSNQNNYPITRNGNATQGSFSPYGSNWSNYFDGSGDYLSVPSNAAFALGTGDFTAECWFYGTTLDSTTQQTLINIGGSGGFIFSVYTNKIHIAQSGVADLTDFITTLVNNRWYHIAIVKASGSIRAYIDGVQQSTAYSDSTSYTATGITAIGAQFNNAILFTGYISNLRVLKGTALYTTSFTPSTSPLTALANTSLLTCQSNWFVDNSPNKFTLTKNGDTSIQRFSPFLPTANASPTVTGGSAYFDGTGDYLSIPHNPSLNLSSGDFTIEAWVWYIEAGGVVPVIFNKDGVYGSLYMSYQFTIVYPSSFYALNVYVASGAGSSGQQLTSGTPIPLRQWVHCAFVRRGTTLTIYQNGVNVASATQTSAIVDAGRPLIIGYEASAPSSALFPGYIADARIVKGSAIYTGNFTPPTAPLQLTGNASIYTSNANVNTTFAAANTSLLMNFTDAAITDSTTLNVVETLGDSRVTSANSVFGGSAMFFDGTGDYLKIPDSENFTYGSNNFTIESRIFPIQTGDRRFYSHYPDSSNQFFIRLNNSTNTIAFNAALSGSTLFSNTSSVGATLNTWSHVAVVRNGNGITTYLNGANVGSVAYSGSLPNYNAPLLISSYDGTNEHFLGYIDDFRVTKGIARYTGNFTVSANAVPLR